jgi:alpha-D-ribose 1-methylphosphonate 5-phosphate C-P lyase
MITNTNATAQTVTVTDGQATPVTVLSAFSIPGNSEVTLPFHGSQMTSGIKWIAGGAGLTGTVVAYQ